MLGVELPTPGLSGRDSTTTRPLWQVSLKGVKVNKSFAVGSEFNQFGKMSTGTFYNHLFQLESI